jgi:hypothetical protein
VVLTYSGSHRFVWTTTSAGANTFPSGGSGSRSFTDGVYTFMGVNFALVTAGEQTITYTDPTLDKSGTSNVVTVTSGVLDHFGVTVGGSPITKSAGEMWDTPDNDVTVTAYDIYGNVVTSYGVTETGFWTASPAHEGNSLPTGPWTFVNGVYTFDGDGFALCVAGVNTITYEDGGKTGSNNSITITPGSIDHFTVNRIRDPQTAGGLSAANVTAYDGFGNVKTDYVGNVTFSSSDTGPSTLLPGDYTFVPADHGAHLFVNEIRLTTAGEQWVRVSDLEDPEDVYGEQTGITVVAASVDHYHIEIVSPQEAGVGFTGAVTARDEYDNVADLTWTLTSSRTGDAALYSDNTYTVPDYTCALTNGYGTLYIKDNTMEDDVEISVHDDFSPMHTGMAYVDIGPGPVDHYEITVIGPSAPTGEAAQTAGVGFMMLVEAFDQFGNKVDATNNVTLRTTSDAKFCNSTYEDLQNPREVAALVDGEVIIYVYDETAETATIVVVDGDGHTGSTEVTIQAAETAFYRFEEPEPTEAPGSIHIWGTAGVGFELIVTAYDQFFNIVTWATNNVTLYSDGDLKFCNDTYGDRQNPRVAALVAGQVTIYLYDETSELFEIEVVDGDGRWGWTFVGIEPGPLDHFTITEPTAPTGAPGEPSWTETAGAGFVGYVEAFDVYGNHVWVEMSVNLSSTLDGKFCATPYTNPSNPLEVAMAGWSMDIYIIDNTAETIAITVDDGQGHTGSADITIEAAEIASYALFHGQLGEPTAAGDEVAGVGFTVDVVAIDEFGNEVTWADNNVTLRTTGNAMFCNEFYGDRQNPRNVFLTAGAVTAYVYDETAQEITITVTDVNGKTGSTTVNIVAGPLASFGVVIGGEPIDVHAGSFWGHPANDVVVTALDAFGNTVTSYEGSPVWSATCAGVFPEPAGFILGSMVFEGTSFKLNVVGSQRLLITDVDLGKSGMSSIVVVVPYPEMSMAMTTEQTSVVAGVEFTNPVTVTVYSSPGNVMTNYVGTVHFTTTDPTKHLPTDYTFTTGVGGDNGVKTFDASLFSFFTLALRI